MKHGRLLIFNEISSGFTEYLMFSSSRRGIDVFKLWIVKTKIAFKIFPQFKVISNNSQP